MVGLVRVAADVALPIAPATVVCAVASSSNVQSRYTLLVLQSHLVLAGLPCFSVYHCMKTAIRDTLQRGCKLKSLIVLRLKGTARV